MLRYRTFLIVISTSSLCSILLLGGITVSSISRVSDQLAVNDNEQIVANDQTAAPIKYQNNTTHSNTNKVINGSVKNENPTFNCVSVPANIVSWWRGEGNAFDSVGNNNGTLLNGAGFSPALVAQGFNFNGSSQFVQIPHSESINPTSALTVEAWVKINEMPPGNAWSVVNKDNPASGPYDLRLNNNGQVGFGILTDAVNSWQGVFSAPNSFTPNSFFHVAGTFNANEGQFCVYINGIPTCSSTQGSLRSLSNTLKIGGDVYNGTYINGVIDEVSIYNRALTSVEIQSIYNAGSQGKCIGDFPLPVISNINPPIAASNQPTSLTITGANFKPFFSAEVTTPQGIVQIPFSDTAWDSANQVRVIVSPGGTPPYLATLKITNPGQLSSSKTFEVGILPPAPEIIGLSPSTINAGELKEVTVTGNNFPQAAEFTAEVTANNETIPITLAGRTFVNSQLLKLRFLVNSSVNTTGTLKITDRFGRTTSKTFQVLAQQTLPSTSLKIKGIEVTQGIQDINTSFQQFVKDRPTFVRVHVKSTDGNVPNVQGNLIIRRNGQVLRNLTNDNLGRNSIKVLTNPNRSSLNDSFIYEIPRGFLNGTLDIEFRGVSHQFSCEGSTDCSKKQIIFTPVRRLFVSLVKVIWYDQQGLPHQPSLSDMKIAEDEIRATLPVSDFVIKRNDILKTEDLAGRPSLPYVIKQLYKWHTNCVTTLGINNEDCQIHYVGIESDPPSGNNVWGVSYVPSFAAATFLGGPKFTVSHELFHSLGRSHTKHTGTENCYDINYPYFGGFIGGRTLDLLSDKGFFGFNPVTKAIYNARTADIMGYTFSSQIGIFSADTWRSDYTTSGIIDYLNGNYIHPTENCQQNRGSDKEKEGLLIANQENVNIIGGTVSFSQNTGQLDSINTTNLAQPITIPNSGTYSILYENNGQPLISYYFEPDRLTDGTTGLFSLILPHNQSATRIVLLHNGVELAFRQATVNSPQITVTSPNGGETLNGSTANLQWTASDADGDSLSYLIQYSTDAGATWQTLATDWTSTNYELNLDSIAGTTQGLIRVIASDGFHSSQDQSDSVFSVRTHAPQASISNPVSDTYFVGDQNIVLNGSAFDYEDGQLNDESLVWTSNINGSLGSGQSLTINALDLSEGNHTITLTARDTSAQIGTATVNIQIFRTAPTIPTTLSIAPNDLNFIAQQGTSVISQPQILSVRNNGEGTINWTASANQSWIQLSETSGTAPSNTEIRVNPSGLALGNYSGTITITTSDAANSPQTVNVSLTIVDYPVSFSKAPFDFDGDGKTDIGIFRPGPAEWWYLRSSDGGNRAIQFGQTSDKIVASDFTGDGKTDIAFWRESTGEWFIIRSEDNSFYAFPFGSSGDVPAPGDFDGDGKTDQAVFRPSSSTWYIKRSSDGGVTIQQFGISEDRPVVADYDGDGKADIAIFRPSVSQWWLLRSTAGLQAVQFGQAGDKTVPGDYTGDGKADIAFWRPSNGNWYILRSENNSFYAFSFGLASDIATPGDYDGDGKFDAAVFRPSTSTWYLQRSTSGFTAIAFGITGDQPLPSVFVR